MNANLYVALLADSEEDPLTLSDSRGRKRQYPLAVRQFRRDIRRGKTVWTNNRCLDCSYYFRSRHPLIGLLFRIDFHPYNRKSRVIYMLTIACCSIFFSAIAFILFFSADVKFLNDAKEDERIMRDVLVPVVICINALLLLFSSYYVSERIIAFVARCLPKSAYTFDLVIWTVCAFVMVGVVLFGFCHWHRAYLIAPFCLFCGTQSMLCMVLRMLLMCISFVDQWNADQELLRSEDAAADNQTYGTSPKEEAYLMETPQQKVERKKYHLNYHDLVTFAERHPELDSELNRYVKSTNKAKAFKLKNPKHEPLLLDPHAGVAGGALLSADIAYRINRKSLVNDVFNDIEFDDDL